MRKLSTNILFLASLTIASSFGANIVVNPTFHQTLSPWVANTQVDYFWAANQFSDGANSGCMGPACVDETNLVSASYLYQDLNTDPGRTYDLSFNFAGAGDPSELKVLWGGSVVLDLVSPSTDSLTYSVSNLNASSASTQLMFLARQDPGFDLLTYVDVEAANADSGANSAAPEPASIALVLGGVGLMGAIRLRRKR